jgi:hypothetical protein
LKFQRRRHSITVLVLVASEENIFNYWYLKFQRRRHSIIGTCSFRGEDIQLLVLEVSEEKIFNPKIESPLL